MNLLSLLLLFVLLLICFSRAISFLWLSLYLYFFVFQHCFIFLRTTFYNYKIIIYSICKVLFPVDLFFSYLLAVDKFNISMHWFWCTWNSSVRTFVDAKLCVYKTVTMGANLHRLIYNLLIAIVLSLYISRSVICRGYAQHKGFGRFNWKSTSVLKIDQSRKLR